MSKSRQLSDAINSVDISESAPADAVTLDSSGNLLVGKTAIGQGTAGFEARSSGQTFCTDDGNTPFLVNRLTSDGELIQLNKDGTNVGSIGVDGGDNLYLTGESGNTGGIYMNDAAVSPAYQGVERDNYYNLGKSGARWKDLYLSGGVYLGGTGAANYLDDYEEGTWIPTMIGTTSGGGTVTSAQTICAKYTKIGNVVHLSVGLSAFDFPNATTFVGSLRLGGLPFASTSRNNYETRAGDVYFFPSAQWDTVTNFTGISAIMNNSSSTIGFVLKRVDDDRQDGLTDSNTNFITGQNKYLRFSITYITDA
jgi:hypothetical protein